jgi:hypothetical protein
MNKKINVLVISGDNDGVGYYRILNPHLCMDDPDINVDIRLLSDGTLPLLDERFISKYNIIFYNKMLPLKPEIEHIFYDLVKKYNIKMVYDIDDYWILNSSHLNYRSWKANKSQEKVEEVLKKSDYVITTTPLFSDIIKEYNTDVFVIENALNVKEHQWVSNKVKSDKTRFIWGGGISHMPDLRLMKDEFKKFDKEFLNNSQVYLCGFDLRIRLADGRTSIDDINRSQWGHFESIFTNDNIYIKSLEYRNFLKNNIKNDNVNYGFNEKFKDEFYQRRWTKAILEYGNMYNEADISLAPLKNNHMFNYCKSQLKVIESGCHKMPIILSKYGPYTIDDIEGVSDGNRKGFYVDESVGDWYSKMKWYTKNPNAIIEHGEANHEYFLKNFEMSVVNKKRADFYKEIVKK